MKDNNKITYYNVEIDLNIAYSQGENSENTVNDMRCHTIGDAIREVRVLRGLTQKQLGLDLGFPQDTAAVRISQYESGVRVPKKDLIRKIETSLSCHFCIVNYVKYELIAETIES